MGDYIQQALFGMPFEQWFGFWTELKTKLLIAGRDSVGFILIGFIFRAMTTASGDKHSADMIKPVAYLGAIVRVLQVLKS